MQDNFLGNVLKGKIIQEIVSCLLTESGYLVIPYGYEVTLSGLTKILHEEQNDYLSAEETERRIRSSPDLLVYKPPNDIEPVQLLLVEVKLRSIIDQKNSIFFIYPPFDKKSEKRGKLRIQDYCDFWGDAFLVVGISLSDSFEFRVIKMKNLDANNLCYNFKSHFNDFRSVFKRVKPQILLKYQAKAKNIIDSSLESTKTKDSEAKPYEKIRQVFPKAYKKWTKDEDEALIEEHQKGMKIKEIAEAHQRKKGAIHSRLKKLGLVSK